MLVESLRPIHSNKPGEHCYEAQIVVARWPALLKACESTGPFGLMASVFDTALKEVRLPPHFQLLNSFFIMIDEQVGFKLAAPLQALGNGDDEYVVITNTDVKVRIDAATGPLRKEIADLKQEVADLRTLVMEQMTLIAKLEGERERHKSNNCPCSEKFSLKINVRFRYRPFDRRLYCLLTYILRLVRPKKILLTMCPSLKD